MLSIGISPPETQARKGGLAEFFRKRSSAEVVETTVGSPEAHGRASSSGALPRRQQVPTQFSPSPRGDALARSVSPALRQPSLRQSTMASSIQSIASPTSPGSWLSPSHTQQQQQTGNSWLSPGHTQQQQYQQQQQQTTMGMSSMQAPLSYEDPEAELGPYGEQAMLDTWLGGEIGPAPLTPQEVAEWLRVLPSNKVSRETKKDLARRVLHFKLNGDDFHHILNSGRWAELGVKDDRESVTLLRQFKQRLQEAALTEAARQTAKLNMHKPVKKAEFLVA